jgi:hypothetical protein
MNEKIIISFLLTAEDYARALRYIQRRSFLVRYSFLLPLLVIFGMLLFLFIRNPQKTVYVFSRPQGFLPFVLAAIIIIPLFYFFNQSKYSSVVKKRFERQIKSSPALQTERTFVFDEDGMIGQSLLASGEVEWNAFIEAAESEDYFYFFTSPKVAQFIPKRAFESEAEQNRLRELVKRKLGDRAKF